MQEKTYEISGKTYVHRPLVLGQLRQMEELLKGIAIPTDAGTLGIVAALGDKAPQALAICLTEQGQSPRDKDLNALAAEMAWSADLALILEVADDFFSFNPISSAFGKIMGIVEGFTEKMLTAETGTSPSAAPSETETSPAETP